VLALLHFPSHDASHRQVGGNFSVATAGDSVNRFDFTEADELAALRARVRDAVPSIVPRVIGGGSWRPSAEGSPPSS
jgi:hypothetical protein